MYEGERVSRLATGLERVASRFEGEIELFLNALNAKAVVGQFDYGVDDAERSRFTTCTRKPAPIRRPMS